MTAYLAGVRALARGVGWPRGQLERIGLDTTDIVAFGRHQCRHKLIKRAFELATDGGCVEHRCTPAAAPAATAAASIDTGRTFTWHREEDLYEGLGAALEQLREVWKKGCEDELGKREGWTKRKA